MRNLAVLLSFCCALILQPATIMANPLGARVVFADFSFGLLFQDEEKGRTLVMGFDVLERCNGGGPSDIIEITQVYIPNINLIKQLAMIDKTPISVWPFLDEGPVDCALYLNNDPLLINGTGMAVRNIIDTTKNSDVSNTHVFEGVMHAVGEDANGDVANARYYFRAVTTGDGTVIHELVDHIDILGEH